MKYTLTKKDGTVETFEDKRTFDRAARKAQKQEERSEERRYRSKREAHRNACVALVQVAQDIDTNGLKSYHFATTVEEYCAPNGWLTCKVPFNSVLNPDPSQKEFASMLGVGLVTAILFDIMDDAVAFRHFRGAWFTVGVSSGYGEHVQLPKSLGEKLDALCAKKE